MPLTEELVTLDLSGDPYSDNGAGILYFVLPNKTAVAEALLKPENVAGLLPTATLTYTATVGEDTYTATKTGYTFAAGKYYAGTLKMNKYPIALSAVTSDYIGSVITTDGNVYATVADATAASKTALAMIAYVGSSTGVDGKTHGLALALSNEDGTKNWTIATGAGGAAAHTPAAPTSITSSWMVPSKDQWTSMINAAGGYVVLRNGFSSIGGDNLNNGSYWSSTGDDSNSSKAWGINFNSGDWLSSAKTNYRNVRASLAF